MHVVSSLPPKKLPVGRFGRLARLAQVGARSGASLIASRDGKGAAEYAAEVLGSLRGLAAKVGQMAGYVDGLVPDEHRDAYETALRGLRAAAPTSSAAAIRFVIETDLGAPIDRLFDAFEDSPLASASIGQVHRARLADGREVAVKVQHPGIDRAIEADLQNASVLELLIGAAAPRALNSKRVLAELAARFREELDYGLEAERQSAFAALHAGDPQIRIPRVIAERSSRRVLTTGLATGDSLEQAALAPEDERRRHAETLWRFVYKGNLIGGLFNADPHPGNYLFGSCGRVTFLDFGCVQSIPPARVRLARELHQAARDRDEPGFAALIPELLQTRGGAYEADAVRYMRRCFEPLFASPFRVSRDYVAEIVGETRGLKRRHLLGGDGSLAPLPEGMVLMSRLQFGFYSVLARLEVEADYAAVERAFLAGISRRRGP